MVNNYEEALKTIVSLLEPLGWKCPDHDCLGCEYEQSEALRTAMDALSGIKAIEFLGPVHSRSEWQDHRRDPDGCTVCNLAAKVGQSSSQLKHKREAAWRKAGFYQVASQEDPEKLVWRPPWTKHT